MGSTSRGQPLLLLHHHRIRQTKDICDHPICINPQHYHVEVNRKLLGITPKGVRVYNDEERYVIPVFSWQIPDPTDEQAYLQSFDQIQDILEDLEYKIRDIDDWKKLPAEQLLAQLGDPNFTVEMIRKLQK